jgi:hypothetical protein
MKNKIDQPKVFIDLMKDNYILTRSDDEKQITVSVIKFIEWSEDGIGGLTHDEPAIGRSIIVNPTVGGNYKLLTTVITEIINENTFKTKNNTYTIHKL